MIRPCSKLIATNYRFLFFVYCSLSRDFKGTRFNGVNAVSSPVTPEIMGTYAEFIRRKFPSLNKDTPFQIKPA